GIEVDRRQHQGREAAAGYQIVDRFAGVGEQDVRAEGAQGVAHGRLIQSVDGEDTGLLYFGDEGDFVIAVGHGRGQAQHHLVNTFLQLAVTGVQIQTDLRVPLALEYRRGLRRLEGQVLHVDALQGELYLRLVGAIGGGVVLLLFSHVQSL